MGGLVSTGAGAGSALAKIVEGTTWAEPPTHTVAAEPRVMAFVSQDMVLGALDDLRKPLDITAQTVAQLLEASARRYYEWRSGEPMPYGRLITASLTASALTDLLSQEAAVAQRLFERDRDEVVSLLATGQFASFRAHVDRARAEVARDVAALSPPLPLPLDLPEGTDTKSFLESVKSATFQAAARILERFAPQTRATEELWRVEAYARLEHALDSLDRADALDGSWQFIITLSGPELREFRERAQQLLESAPSADAWTLFLAEEEERALGTFDFQPLEPGEEGSHDLAARFRPDELFNFDNLGFDGVTGAPGKER